MEREMSELRALIYKTSHRVNMKSVPAHKAENDVHMGQSKRGSAAHSPVKFVFIFPNVCVRSGVRKLQAPFLCVRNGYK